MSEHVFRATRVCAECHAEFSAIITLAETTGIVWWRCDPRHLPSLYKES